MADKFDWDKLTSAQKDSTTSVVRNYLDQNWKNMGGMKKRLVRGVMKDISKKTKKGKTKKK